MVRAWLTTKQGKIIYVSTSDGRSAMHRAIVVGWPAALILPDTGRVGGRQISLLTLIASDGGGVSAHHG